MSCLRDVQQYFFPQWAQNLVSRPFFLLSTTTNLADASVRGFTGLVNTAVCVWYVGGYVTQLRPAHNQIHQMLALGGLGGRLKTGHTWTLQNRPMEQNQNKSIYTLITVVWATFF
jgi:hypothetical protein